MAEEWKDIEGFAGLYQVSNLGRVKSMERVRDGANMFVGSFDRTYQERFLSPLHRNRSRDIDGGYLSVTLYKDNKNKMYFIHRLVALAFIPLVEGKPEVDHIDGNKGNNCVENLRWADRVIQNNNRDMPLGKTKERYITCEENKYRCRIKKQKVWLYSETFKTLPEAIAARDAFLATLNLQP